MKCCYCGGKLNASDVCPNCYSNVRIWKKVQFTSNYLYNEGLSAVRWRDMTRAVEKLTLSLRYSKTNTQARNLLGLVYYETGELYYAVLEWKTSLQLQPENNDAKRYLSELRRSSARIDAGNMNIRKYNQVVSYCRQKNYDLAEIQLKKILAKNPRLVKGNLLMALLLMRQGRYDHAGRYLKKVREVDSENPTMYRYQEECSRHLTRDGRVITPKSREKKPTLAERYRAFYSRTSVASAINLLAGIAIGIAVMAILIIPSVRQRTNSASGQDLVEANQTINSKNAEIEDLEDQIKSLADQLEASESSADTSNRVIQNYEALLTAYQYYADEDYTAAGEALGAIDLGLLDQKAQTVYTDIETNIKDTLVKQYYDEGMSQYWHHEYQAAAESLLKAVTLDEGYADYDAAFFLADAYHKMGDEENAEKWKAILPSRQTSDNSDGDTSDTETDGTDQETADADTQTADGDADDQTGTE